MKITIPERLMTQITKLRDAARLAQIEHNVATRRLELAYYVGWTWSLRRCEARKAKANEEMIKKVSAMWDFIYDNIEGVDRQRFYTLDCNEQTLTETGMQMPHK